MASQTPITDWCLANHDILKPQIQSLNWTEEWLPGHFDFEVVLRISGTTVTGRGTDKNQRLSLEKAFAEAIERHFTIQNRLYYHGVAVHTDEKLAKSNAFNEFYERSIFLTESLEPRQAFSSLNGESEIEAPQDLAKKIEGLGYQIKTKILGSASAKNGIVYTLISSIKQNSNLFWGISNASTGVEAAVEKSLVESVRGFVGFLHTGKCESPIPTKNGIVKTNHGSVALISDSNIFKTAPLTFAYTTECYFEFDKNRELDAVASEK